MDGLIRRGFLSVARILLMDGNFPGLFGFTQQPFRVDQVRMERKMKWVPVTAVLIAGPAFAQSAELESACTSVARNFFMTETLNVGVVQSSLSLSPLASASNILRDRIRRRPKCQIRSTANSISQIRSQNSYASASPGLATLPTRKMANADADLKKCSFLCKEAKAPENKHGTF